MRPSLVHLLSSGAAGEGIPCPVHATVSTESDTRKLAAEIGANFRAGETVLLYGPLGAGKTTFVRGYLESLGVAEPVRSPTFNLIQVFDTVPPVMHADLYRVQSAAGIGLEDYLDTYVCLIEWPEKLGSMVEPSECWRIQISFRDGGRFISAARPGDGTPEALATPSP